MQSSPPDTEEKNLSPSWKELKSSCRRDSDYPLTALLINRISLVLTWVLIPLRIHPNTVTLFSILTGLTVGVAYSYGHLWTASGLIIISHVLDCTDGNLARATRTFSPQQRARPRNSFRQRRPQQSRSSPRRPSSAAASVASGATAEPLGPKSMNSKSLSGEIEDERVHEGQLVAKDVGRISISKTNPIVRPGNVSTESSTGDGVHVFDTQRTTSSILSLRRC